MNNLDFVWSNTDYPYQCLRDEVRTNAFRLAIHCVVKPGDIVIDVGAGSGILSFFAAEAGAEKVYSVEIEHMLAQELKKSIVLNGFEDKIEVVEGDIRKVDLVKNVDVLIAEIIDTGLLDELQAPAINSLRDRGIISQNTHLIPCHYKTFMQLVYSDNSYYGYQVTAPKHEWPFYNHKNSGWVPSHVKPVSEKVEIASMDFSIGSVEEDIKKTVKFHLKSGKKANAIRLSGIIKLADGLELGPTNALNGDKIISINPIESESEVTLKIGYKMGNGLHSLKVIRIE